MTTALLTGFEPFGGDAANPSGDAVGRVAADWTGPGTLVTAILPVTFAGAAQRLRELIAEHQPDVVIATGLAGGRSAIGVERIAVNLVDARIPDNDGAQPVDAASIPGAPAAAFATLPVKAIAAAIRDAGVPAEVSHTAGTFVCNHVFFTALSAVPADTRAGFIHVPWAIGQAPTGEPALPLADIARALRTALDATLTGTPETRTPAGTLH